MTNKQAFITAVESEDTGTVKELLASDQTLAAHIDAPWFSFDAPAIVFAAASGNRELIKVLNVTDDKGRTPIHIIAQKGFGKNQVQLLIEHGGDINIRDVDGKIPLDYARKAKKKVVENFLMEYANRAQKET